MNIYGTTAIFPGKSYAFALNRLHTEVLEVGGVKVKTEKIQLCPQTRDVMTVEVAKFLRMNWPKVDFRLHANCKMSPWLHQFDASTPWDEPWVRTYVNQMKKVQKALGASVFSWHASGHSPSNLKTAIDSTKRLSDELEVVVAIEGLYPGAHSGAVLTNEEEYEVLAKSGVPMALDLSHLYICYHQGTLKNKERIAEWLANDKCLEVHLSYNDGCRDSHASYPAGELPFGWEFLLNCSKNASIFSESRSV